jgi:NAD(P)-dependent dehydrogenase (short-subunit alcohol dehydrogenase family)
MAQEQRVAIVTGANRGIGLEVVRQLAQQGMTVILGARDLKKGETAAEKLAGEGLKVLPRQLDVTDEQTITRLATQVEQEFARLDVLVNNAGIPTIPGKSQAQQISIQLRKHSIRTRLDPGVCVKHSSPCCGTVSMGAL